MIRNRNNNSDINNNSNNDSNDENDNNSNDDNNYSNNSEEIKPFGKTSVEAPEGSSSYKRDKTMYR